MPSKKGKLATITEEVNQFHPLLAKLLPKLPNVIHVEYTHGPTEMGADFVISKRHDIFGNTEYIGIVAKVGKVVQDFSDIERQIEECAVPRTFSGGRDKIRLDEVWVIVTEHITKGAQDKIHEKYKTRKLHFIDGYHLEVLIDNYVPSYWTDINLEIGEYLNTLHARNEEIDRAMSLLQIADKSFYIDQDIYEFPRSNYMIKLQRLNKSPKKIDIFEVVEKNNFILIEGTMGSGKSKLLRNIISHYTSPEVFKEKNLLPIFITYKDLIDKFEGNIDRLIDERIDPKLKDELNGVEYLLLIDAIDEKNLSIDKQLEALNSLTKNVSEHKNSKAIITSRYLKGLDQSNDLNEEISSYEIRPLSLNRTIEFITQICTQLNITSRIIEDLKKSQLFRELPKSPIAAILLAKLLNENLNDLPSNVTELYSKYIELMLGRWDIEKGLQQQKEYQALNNILIDISKYMLENELTYISVNDTREIFETYLSVRNLEIKSDELFDKMVNRCEVMVFDWEGKSLAFKHRTFTEFFYAKHLVRDKSLEVDERAFNLYWTNTFFFYLGIQRDCPEILEEIIQLIPRSETARWIKLINMSNYFLAAYASPYEVVVKGLVNIMVESAQLYNDIISGKIESTFSRMPRMHILFLMQLIVRSSYSYTFFKSAIEDAALTINDRQIDESLKVTALFFLNVTYIELEDNQSFDFLLNAYSGNIPLDIAMAMRHEAKSLKERTTLMKKQDKRIRLMLRDDESLRAKIEEMYEKPVRRMYPKQLNSGMAES